MLAAMTISPLAGLSGFVFSSLSVFFSKGAEYCDDRVCMCVCLSVSSLAYLKNNMSKTSQNFLYMLPVAEAWSSCDDSAISYVLPVLFAHNGPYGAWLKREYSQSDSPGGSVVSGAKP